jgi:hypothetical protein
VKIGHVARAARADGHKNSAGAKLSQKLFSTSALGLGRQHFATPAGLARHFIVKRPLGNRLRIT